MKAEDFSTLPHVVEEIQLFSRITNFHFWLQQKNALARMRAQPGAEEDLASTQTSLDPWRSVPELCRPSKSPPKPPE